MGVALRSSSLADVEQVRLWRNEVLEALRTPFRLTQEMQADFYANTVCNRAADSRWWSVYDGSLFIGLAGLCNIQWENGLAEISLIIDPEKRGKGYGVQAVDAVLAEGFGNLGLDTIYGECYECNPALGFWDRMVGRRGGYTTMLPRRKRWQGKLYDSLYFAFCYEEVDG